MKKLIKSIIRILILFLTSSVKLKHYILELLENDPIKMEETSRYKFKIYVFK